MLRELLCSLLMLSLFVDARPSSTLQLSYDDQVPATNESNAPPTFEELSRQGWQRMRLGSPYSQLKLISALPTNEEPSGSNFRAFRHVVIVGYDTGRERWLHICNQGGRNTWEPVRQIPMPPAVIRSLPTFVLENYEFTFEAAFRQTRRAGLTEPWAEVRLSAEEFAGSTGETSYVFMAVGFRHGALVDVHDGQVRRIEPPGADEVGISLVAGLDLRNITSDDTAVETS